jgi:CesT_Tir_1
MTGARLSSAGFPTNLRWIMKSAEDIESYLLRMGVAHETIKPGIWLVKIDGSALVVSIAGPVVAFRLKVMELPRSGREELYRTLLALNTTDMVHGAFGVEADTVVLVAALELENLDLNEFQAVVDDMAMAVSKHHATLSRFAPPTGASASAT